MRRARLAGLALVAFVAAFALIQWWDFTVPAPFASRYQAVFLANGQTYFGRYTDRLGPYAEVENAYYIQQTRSEKDPDAPPDQRIVRRGQEPHQPLPRVLIPKSSVLFVEDLQPGSRIGRFMDAQP
ncbi:MAG TPA: hypothetical protein VFM93_07840 [Candidatus Limnocylindria bacterium]|nr:hypothetical protein [Candidatus Limnocylindria bacterium]